MSDEVLVSRFSAGTIFKLVAIGLGMIFFPLMFIVGVFSFLGAEIVTVNDAYVTGVYGFLVSLFIGAIMTFILTAILGLSITIGLWLFSKILAVTFSVFK